MLCTGILLEYTWHRKKINHRWLLLTHALIMNNEYTITLGDT